MSAMPLKHLLRIPRHGRVPRSALLLATLAAGGHPTAQVPVPDPACLRLDQRVEPSASVDTSFGSDVALSGDTLLVGAPSSAGSGGAYVFERGPGGTWVETALLASGAPPPSALLGSAVALDGDVAVLGGFDVAFVFERALGLWSPAVPLIGSDSLPGDLFGRAVAVEGERILVGAHADDDNGSQSGTVFVFERVGGSWTEVAKLYPDDAQALQQFGAAVALSGERALIGAWGADGSSPGQGAAYVLAFDELLGWQQEQKLGSSSPSFITFFGWSVDLSGGRAIVGNGRSDVQGSAYVFGFDGAAWQLEQALGDGRQAPSVAIDGDVALVGEPGHMQTGPHVGRTLMYVRRTSGWVLDVERPGPDPLGRAGTAVDIEASSVVTTIPDFAAGGVVTGAAEMLTLRPFQTPLVATRNAGSNPFSYSAAPASIGETLVLTVFPASTGHTHALVIGFDSPGQVALASGQTLLCLDLLGSGEVINTGFRPGPIARFELAIPDDLALSGFAVCTQAIHAFGAMPFLLSNAQDLVIGGCL